MNGLVIPRDSYTFAILDAIPTGISLIDTESREICWMNKVALGLVEASIADVVGNICHCFICPSEEGQCPILDQGLEIDNSERVLLTLNRDSIPIIKSVQRLTISGHEYLCESFIDITVLKNTESELRENKDKLQLLLNQMPCSLWTMDTDLRFTSISGAALKATGRNPSDMIGKTVYEYSAQFNEKSAMVKALRRALKGKSGSFEQRTMLGDRYHLCHFESMYDVNGKITGVIGIGFDITERKKAELQIKEDKRKIRELAHAYVSAQEKEREWLSLEIHDRIIQPLSSAIHAIESGNQNTLQSKEALSFLKEAVKESRNIMKEIYPETLTRFGLVRQIETELNHLREATPCNVEFCKQCDCPIPHDVETTTYRVFHEALLNIKNHAQAKTIKITLICKTEYLEMTISDDGIGFDYQAKLKRRIPGGLESMKQRTEIIGGKFRIESLIGQGTTINIYIPTPKESLNKPRLMRYN
ncbi:putative PAS/PAC sensor protein [Dehalogenimonas lykanthroporepellens BL-DC-9]|nr:putative PAS/PAC sensor protein [Dehalogenimonas lykanthroporepellens BL-DC-9]